MSYQLSTENGAAAMDVTKLQAAIQKQDEYLSSRGHLSDVRPETKTSMTSPVRSSVPSKNVMVPRSSENWYSPGKIRKSWSAVRSAFIPSTRVSRFRLMAAIL